MTVSHIDADNEKHKKEWEEARGVLKFYDERLHDLRKYGFSFLTALLAAGSILSEIVPGATPPSTITPDKVKLAVFVVTLMLIVALHLFDKNYRVFQQAAFTRALVLERKLNIELSEIISDRYKSDKIARHVLYVYILFICGVALLGGFILYPNWSLIRWLAVAVIVALGFIIYQDTLRLQYRHEELKLKDDWTVSPLECTGDEAIRITLNNMGNNPIVFEEGKLIWEIKSEGVPLANPCQKLAEMNMEVPAYGNYTWVQKPSEFPGGGLKKGVYQLQPWDWDTPLPISIIVSD
jgi:hypothetical protein